ncbi:hypothetical protein, partial [Porphyromonas sp.]|uniref:hypothetical protein n=1 Tax=Porphyromonas sp. TaxID=1924944 RepID=UPI0025DF8390
KRLIYPLKEVDFGESVESATENVDLHVGNLKSPRGRGKILRRNEMKLRRTCFSPTWGIKNSHVGIRKSPRGY